MFHKILYTKYPSINITNNTYNNNYYIILIILYDKKKKNLNITVIAYLWVVKLKTKPNAILKKKKKYFKKIDVTAFFTSRSN